MNLRFFKLWREHPMALLVELGLFAAFLVSLFVMATLKTPVSTWALVPHVLCNVSLLVLLVRHRVQGRPAMYWTHFDVMVMILFVYFLANVYYSEIRSISWETAALYMDALAAYFLGRMLFYHRVRLYTILLVCGLGISLFAVHSGKKEAVAFAAGFRGQAAKLVSGSPGFEEQNQDLQMKAEFQDSVVYRLEPVQRLYILMFAFWILTMVFLLLEKPSRLAFLVYTVGMLALYGFYILGRINWLVGEQSLASTVVARNGKLESLRTAMRTIRAYPATGGGLGTFPILFDAYRLSPASVTVSGFNAYVYSAVETGMVGALLLLYILVRFPLHVLRRWRLFPNRRLRFAILAHLLFLVLFLVQGFHDADLFRPAIWFPVWAVFGTLVSLVEVRDHVRVFESLVPAGRAHDPMVQERRILAARPGSVFGRTPLARLPRPKARWIGRSSLVNALVVSVVLAVLVFLSVLETVPYIALRLARTRLGEPESSVAYYQRLKKAAEIFPIDSTTWSKIGDHFSACVAKPLEIYKYSSRMEEAYRKAIALNPYRPALYEQLYFLYRDVNRTEDALQVMKDGVESNPNHLVLRLLLVRELEKIGDLPQATYHVRKAVFRIAPDKTELLLRLAELYDLQGMTNEARLYYQYARQVVPRNAQTMTRLRRLRQNLDMPSLND